MTEPSKPAYDEPMTATPVDGEVAITGPGHIHGSMTPDAAKRSARRLKDVAESAERQPAASPEGDETEPNPG